MRVFCYLHPKKGMLYRQDPTLTNAWSQLRAHHSMIKGFHMRELFDTDPDRFHKFSVHWKDFLFDYSKNRILETTMPLLFQLAEEMQVKQAINAMFAGTPINETEHRPVLHVALRNRSGRSIMADGKDVMPLVTHELNKMREFSESVRNGNWKGGTGKAITDVVNIGIGGSDLGSVMVTEALKPYHHQTLRTHFVSNVDGSHISQTLRTLNPETTLFLVASKSFTTLETMTNAHTAKQWFLDSGGKEIHISAHFIAISTNTKAVDAFGMDSAQMFQFWDWVGGRFSLASAIGLPIAIAIGFEAFEELLAGMHDMDEHFRSAVFDYNLPVILALIGIWNTNFLGAESCAILPYDQNLHRFPAYLQQAEMESNGKRATRSGEFATYQTCPIIWGEPGTNGQHAFFQLMHQGTRLIPSDFILAANPHDSLQDHHHKLAANCFAQSEALMRGKTADEARLELEELGMTQQLIERLLPSKTFPGNQPSNTLLISKLTPRNLGRLIALYEHKIFVQGVIWNIYSFDQWGVELGKQLAGKILPELQQSVLPNGHDSSTQHLIQEYLSMNIPTS